MGITKKNAIRLASLSALGAGALGVSAGTAEASVIYEPLNGKVGFGPGYGSQFLVSGIVPSVTFNFARSGGTRSGAVQLTAHTASFGRRGTVSFKTANAAAGQKWGTLAGSAVTYQMLGSRRGSVNSFFGPNGTFYKLFRFGGVGTTTTAFDYGWLKLDQAVSSTTGPELQILGVAYDNTGAQIAAGDVGSTIPEPGTAALTSFAALALGAASLRRWRATRKKTA